MLRLGRCKSSPALCRSLQAVHVPVLEFSSLFLLFFPSSQCRARVTKAIPLEQPWCGITLSFLLHISITKKRGAVCQTKAFCELQRENITGIVINCIVRKQKDQCLENKEQLLKMKHFMFIFATYCHSSWITANHYKPLLVRLESIVQSDHSFIFPWFWIGMCCQLQGHSLKCSGNASVWAIFMSSLLLTI